MIHTCVVTHNRLPYTQRCLDSYLKTARETRLVVVDNNSDDGTAEWLQESGHNIVLNDTNRYPGAACNQGWDRLQETYGTPDFYHRSDNDIEYLPGWQEEVEAVFADNPDLVLLGILNLHEDRRLNLDDAVGIEPTAVGGNVVMRLPLRWNEDPWDGPANEDYMMCQEAGSHGLVARLERTVANNMAFCGYDDFPSYYDHTAAVRGYPDARATV